VSNTAADIPPPAPAGPAGSGRGHAAPRRDLSERILAICAIVISAISLWVAFDTQQSNRQLVAEGAWPFVQIFASGGSDEPRVLTLNIANAGIGPAKIEALELFWNGHAYASASDLLKDCCGRPVLARAGSDAPVAADATLGTSTVVGTVLRPGDTVPIIRYALSSGNADFWNAFRAQRFRITHRICFCSALDECWLTKTQAIGGTQDLDPPRVAACPRPALGYVE
jgi:hypothetical protein